MRHLKIRTFAISEIKFIASQLILALEELHHNKIVHRDLKPENVLIDDEGYIKLADFGLAKDISEQAGEGFWGTLEYTAPEIVNETEEGHNYMVDWWTLGVLMYELYYGQTPFLDVTKEKVLSNIINNKPKFPKNSDEKNTTSFELFK